MKVRFMHADRAFDPGAAMPDNEPDLAADLELGEGVIARKNHRCQAQDCENPACKNRARNRNSTHGEIFPEGSFMDREHGERAGRYCKLCR